MCKYFHSTEVTFSVSMGNLLGLGLDRSGDKGLLELKSQEKVLPIRSAPEDGGVYQRNRAG